MKFNTYLEKIDELKFKRFDFNISDEILMSLKDNVLEAYKKFYQENSELQIDDQAFYDKLFPTLRAELEK